MTRDRVVVNQGCFVVRWPFALAAIAVSTWLFVRSCT